MCSLLKISFCFSPTPRYVLERQITLAAGSTLADALKLLDHDDAVLFLDPESLKASDCASHVTALPKLKDGFSAAIWSKPALLSQPLSSGDRIEVLRPIKVDPKVARRERFKKQGVKAAGLFAKKRPGSKAGY